MNKTRKDILIEDIFRQNRTYEDLANVLEAKWFIREGWFVRKHIIERKDNKVVRYELYINSKRTYYRLKNRIFTLLTIWH